MYVENAMKNKYMFGEVFKLLIHVAERKEAVHKANVLLYKKHFWKKFKKKEKHKSIESYISPNPKIFVII